MVIHHDYFVGRIRGIAADGIEKWFQIFPRVVRYDEQRHHGDMPPGSRHPEFRIAIARYSPMQRRSSSAAAIHPRSATARSIWLANSSGRRRSRAAQTRGASSVAEPKRRVCPGSSIHTLSPDPQLRVSRFIRNGRMQTSNSAQVCGQLAIGFFTEEMDIRQFLKAETCRTDAPGRSSTNEYCGRLLATSRNQLQVEPVGDGAVVSDHRPRKVREERSGRRITEEFEIRGVGNQLGFDALGSVTISQAA